MKLSIVRISMVVLNLLAKACTLLAIIAVAYTIKLMDIEQRLNQNGRK